MLTHLNLSYCNLRDSGLEWLTSLSSLKSLEELIIAGNEFGQTGLETLTRQGLSLVVLYGLSVFMLNFVHDYNTVLALLCSAIGIMFHYFLGLV